MMRGGPDRFLRNGGVVLRSAGSLRRRRGSYGGMLAFLRT